MPVIQFMARIGFSTCPQVIENGRRGWTRTSDPQLRRLMLYPPELRALEKLYREPDLLSIAGPVAGAQRSEAAEAGAHLITHSTSSLTVRFWPVSTSRIRSWQPPWASFSPSGKACMALPARPAHSLSNARPDCPPDRSLPHELCASTLASPAGT
jgi:hypothetical protein